MLDWDKNNPNKQTNKSYQKDLIKIDDKSEKSRLLGDNGAT